MINEEIKKQLENAASSDKFCAIATQNNLQYSGNFGHYFTISAYVEGDYNSRVCSPYFCSACGEQAVRMKRGHYLSYCKPCAIEFNEWDEDDQEYGAKPFSDPFIHSLADVPERITRSECEDDRMAMFRNEY